MWLPAGVPERFCAPQAAALCLEAEGAAANIAALLCELALPRPAGAPPLPAAASAQHPLLFVAASPEAAAAVAAAAAAAGAPPPASAGSKARAAHLASPVSGASSADEEPHAVLIAFGGDIAAAGRMLATLLATESQPQLRGVSSAQLQLLGVKSVARLTQQQAQGWWAPPGDSRADSRRAAALLSGPLVLLPHPHPHPLTPCLPQRSPVAL